MLAQAVTCLELMVRTTSKARDMVGQPVPQPCVVVSNHSDDADKLVFAPPRVLDQGRAQQVAFKNAGGNELTIGFSRHIDTTSLLLSGVGAPLCSNDTRRSAR